MSTAITKVGGGWAIAPANMNELFSFAKLLADSELVPKDYRDKPGNCMVAIQMGGELGLSPMQAIQNIAVINGRPSLWGDAMLAVCLPHLDDFKEPFDDATMTATCFAKRGKREVVNTFSMEDAKKAGLWDKAGPWKQYPKRMLKARARGFTLRDICADILRGIQSAEESQDIPREVKAEVVSSKPTSDQSAAAAKPEVVTQTKKEPPPPCFAGTFPIKEWANKPMQDAPPETLADYIAFCEGVIGDKSRQRLHKSAAASKTLAEAVLNARVEAEMARAQAAAADDAQQKVTDEIAEGLQREQDRLRGGGDDHEGNDPVFSVEQGRDGWGLTP